ncbi:hypothetical protein ACFYNF_31090 [Streptomyces sp. NPDC006641]|uniref:hypothetical protein n=1 Tax=unclassified Streptomyces TaxID=2593676 RepID=UPI0036C5457C
MDIEHVPTGGGGEGEPQSLADPVRVQRGGGQSVRARRSGAEQPGQEFGGGR